MSDQYWWSRWRCSRGLWLPLFHHSPKIGVLRFCICCWGIRCCISDRDSFFPDRGTWSLLCRGIISQGLVFQGLLAFRRLLISKIYISLVSHFSPNLVRGYIFSFWKFIEDIPSPISPRRWISDFITCDFKHSCIVIHRILRYEIFTAISFLDTTRHGLKNECRHGEKKPTDILVKIHFLIAQYFLLLI